VPGLRSQLSVQHVGAKTVKQSGQERVIDAADKLGCLRGQRMERAVAQFHLGWARPRGLEPVLREHRLRDGERTLGAKPPRSEPVTLGSPENPAMLPRGADGSLVFDVGSQLVSKPGFLTQGSEWLIAVGLIGALAAAMVGFLDLAAIPAGTRAFRTACTHMCLNLGITTAYAVGFWWRRTDYAHGGAVRPGMLALSAASLAALGLSGYLGGKLAYRWGVRVADEQTQAEGFTPAASEPAGNHRAPSAS